MSQESGGLSQESAAASRDPDPRQLLLDELPPGLRRDVQGLGQRSRVPDRIPMLIRSLCAYRPYLARELALLLGRRQDYLHRRYIAPLVEDGTLKYRYPNEPNRPDQAYMSTEDSP